MEMKRRDKSNYRWDVVDEMTQIRIGILTFQNTMNFGAMLQCYGLYRTIEGLGQRAEVIDYACRKVESREGTAFDGSLKSAAKVVLRRRKAKEFSRFLHGMTLSPRCNRKSFPEVAAHYDRIVVGSDQVWNPECTGYDKTFFLDQIEDRVKKLSYAASIGLERFPECDFDYAELLGGFSSLLVREETAAREVRRYVDDPVSSVLDPTLLADPSIWEGIRQTPLTVDGRDYVLVYAISEHDRSLRAARKIASDRGLKIVQIQQYGLNRTKDAINLRNVSPEEFVGLFVGAKAAVVSSFHGVCFSIISGTDFFYATDTGAGSKASRVLDLLKLLGIERRSVDDCLDGTASPIDWSLVEARLLAERQRSLTLLANSLEES